MSTTDMAMSDVVGLVVEMEERGSWWRWLLTRRSGARGGDGVGNNHENHDRRGFAAALLVPRLFGNSTPGHPAASTPQL